MLGNTNALVIDDSEVGINQGDIYRWNYYINDTFQWTMQISISDISTQGGNLVVEGEIKDLGTLGYQYTGNLLEFNDTTDFLDLSGQIDLLDLGGYCIIPIPLNLTLMTMYLDNEHGLANLNITDNLIYGDYPNMHFYWYYNSQGLLTQGGILVGETLQTMVLVTNNDGGNIPIGYTIYLIISLSIIVLLIKKYNRTIIRR
ncbi:MAG: hypothetical protein JXA99_05770 [Candidatus Lokiarchaeota archaeon]|nr:hypothetical protein [Candidatus Lokiarchaeota archaeon]